MKKIIVFGATGALGAYTVKNLAEAGYIVYAVGRRISDNNYFASIGVSYFSCDICKKESFNILPNDFDTVVHFAGAMPAHMKEYNPYEYIDSIITGTLNILEFMRKCHCQHIIFSQSISDVAYKFGTTNPILPDSERHFPFTGDHAVYSISKNAAVNLIEHYSAQYDIRRFIFRLPTIYRYYPSPYYYVNGQKKWLGYRFIIDQAIKGNTLEIWGNPNAIKEMVYINDFVEAIRCAVDSNLKGGIYNMGCGNPVSIEYQIQNIARIFAKDKISPIIYKPEKPSSPQFVLDISKTCSELGYKPKYDFCSMMEDFKLQMELEPFAMLWGRKEDYNDYL